MAWLFMFAKAWQVNYLKWEAYAALGLGVWVIYVCDRLIDQRLRDPNDPSLGERHTFHARHRLWFIGGVVLSLCLIPWFVLTELPVELLLSYSAPAVGLVVAFFILVIAVPREGEVPYLRNLIAGLAFGYGTAMMAHTSVPSQGMMSMVLSREMIAFAVLCVLNITAIHLWEHSRMSSDPEVKAADEMSLTLPLTLLGGSALVFAYFDNPGMFGRGVDGANAPARPFFYAVLISAALLQVLNRTRRRFSLDALRVMADVALVVPLPLFLIFSQG
ncbi:4-hydroxybenzoatepolyprenyl transferase [Haloferula helveola]|uniref:4-hydroxybenzoatepolyprenyl transferase n=2 Tax=Haloferula helveola TaxID=490095 RepID=A0ABM7RC11_9BACT|nr:4-hydroxybenzoatepolyprenyl transferase [Haloferula helveola]